MKMMMYIMPIMMVFIFFNLASGLNLYYATANIATIPQQIWINGERKKMRATQGAAKPAAQKAARLELLTTPGECESVAVAFYAHQGMQAPKATLRQLVGPPGPPDTLTADVRWTQRLLKRIQYTRDPEDAVFTWRYLWRESPEQVSAGQVRQLVVTVSVPDNAAPGTYRGDVYRPG